MPRHHILDGEPPPEPVRIAWGRIVLLAVVTLVMIGAALTMFLRFTFPQGGEAGAVTVLHCTDCTWMGEQRVADIMKENCPDCNAPAGYAMRCRECKEAFAYRPAEGADAVPSAPPSVCPLCGVGKVDYILALPKPVASDADER